MSNLDDDPAQANLIERLNSHFPEYHFEGLPLRSSYDNYHVLGHTRAPQRTQDAYTGYVVARVSRNGIRIEREFKQALILANDADYGTHFLQPVKLLHMPATEQYQVELIASVVQVPSASYLDDLSKLVSVEKPASPAVCLDFGIGACGALEIMHHRHGLVHGELRNDAFLYHPDTHTVRLLNFGSGARTFVSRFSTTGWTDLLSETGIKYKLQFFAPEQTGRLPVDPDMRTDIYALGLGLWHLATGRLPFAGDEPLEIIQSVLSQPLPSIQTFRLDMQAFSSVVEKMTRKTMHERYNSISSVKRDLEQIRQAIADKQSLSSFRAGRNDISPVYKLPNKIIGRKEEQETILRVLDQCVRLVETRADRHIEHKATQEQDTALASIITIRGRSGYGKTFLLHSLQTAFRSRSISATVQLAEVKPQPLAPILKLVSSLFKQIFSDTDVNTTVHTLIREQVRPYWAQICPHLDLPLWLLDTDTNVASPSADNVNLSTCTDTISAQYIKIILDVLRIIARHKLICLMLDDADMSDDGSLEILEVISATVVPLVLIITTQPDRANAHKIEKLSASILIDLQPFTEDETTLYVSQTIHHSIKDCTALGSLVYDRTSGVPSSVRDFMDGCYKAEMIEFSWKHGCWQYDIDKIAQHVPSASRTEPAEGTIHHRYKRLAQGAQTVLGWASLLGYHFSITLLLAINEAVKSHALRVPAYCDNCLQSLNLATSKFILRPTENDDVLRFTDDSYWTAATMLNDGYDLGAMHYIVAISMIRHDGPTYQVAEHIVSSNYMDNATPRDRAAFVRILHDAAVALRATGSFATGAIFCDAFIDMCADDMWSSESARLYSQAAEIYHLAGRIESSLAMLDKIEQNVDDICQRTPATITRSRIYAAQGRGMPAYATVAAAVAQLRLPFIPANIVECDKWLSSQPSTHQNHLPCDTGALLSETILASLWMQEPVPYKYAVALTDAGDYDSPHVTIGLIYLSALALFRLKKPDLCHQLREAAVRNMSQQHFPRDVWSRALVLRALLLGHLEVGSRDQIDGLTQALESSSTINDKSFVLLNIATLVVLRVCIADDLDSLLQFIDYSTRDISGWQNDRQNGILLICTRQVVRTLKGTTKLDKPETIMCDPEHDSLDFIQTMQEPSHEVYRVIYAGCRTVMMNFYGYNKEAFELGRTLMPWVDDIRVSLFFNAIFYQVGLAIAVMLRLQPDRSDRQELLEHITRIRARIELLAALGIPQAQAWLLVLEGEVANDSSTPRLLNQAIETIEGRGSPIEEGICLELFIKCLIRMGAASAVPALVTRCSASFSKAGATAKAAQVLQLSGGNSEISPVRSMPKGRLPDSVIAHGPSWEQTRRPRHERTDSLHNNIDHDAMKSNENMLGSLDVIDLHSIISSSQAMSSELNIDRLLESLTKIIAESTAAEICSIVIQPDDKSGWNVAALQSRKQAIKSPSSQASVFDSIPMDCSSTRLDDWDNLIAKQVNTYVLRFREEILIHNTQESEIFANFSNLGRHEEASVLCVPLIHSGALLGSIYCQASPNTFTHRTLTLIKHLVSQISICLSNATLFKCLEKASAENLSMLDKQKVATEQAKSAEAHAIDMLRQKEDAMKAKDMFLANISHELRTPLNGVIGLADILKDTQLTDEQFSCIQSIGVCADTLLNVINDILDFSKLEAGKMQCVNSPICISQKLKDIIHALKAAKLNTHVETIDNIQIDSDLVVLGDLPRLQQVIMNLMTNAYKFTSHGQVIVSAKVEKRIGQILTIHFSVQDSGIGIAAESQQKLFKPFSQADSSTERTYGGTGLGLSICKAIIETVMSGRIWLTSESGKGTTVSFAVPFEVVKTTPSISRPSSPHPAAILDRRLKICIAEDNAINRKIAIAYVQKLGHAAEAYEDGRQAVVAINTSMDFDMVLMDVQMPVLDGYSATKELRKSSNPRINEIIVIALTASTIKGDRDKCIAAGMNGYVAKPVRFQTLKDAIATFL